MLRSFRRNNVGFQEKRFFNNLNIEVKNENDAFPFTAKELDDLYGQYSRIPSGDKNNIKTIIKSDKFVNTAAVYESLGTLYLYPAFFKLNDPDLKLGALIHETAHFTNHRIWREDIDKLISKIETDGKDERFFGLTAREFIVDRLLSRYQFGILSWGRREYYLHPKTEEGRRVLSRLRELLKCCRFVEYASISGWKIEGNEMPTSQLGPELLLKEKLPWRFEYKGFFLGPHYEFAQVDPLEDFAEHTKWYCMSNKHSILKSETEDPPLKDKFNFIKKYSDFNG